MANNGRFTGFGYVAKGKSDSNNGLTWETAKATISGGFAVSGLASQILVVGTGVYTEAISMPFTAFTLQGDGVVTCKGNGANSFGGGAGSTVNNLRIEGYASLTVPNVTNMYNGCIFKTIPLITGTSAGVYQFNNCVFIDCDASSFGGSGIQLVNCLLINSPMTKVTKCINTYANGASPLSVKTGTVAADFDYNNLMGNITMADGASAGLALSFSAHRTAYPTFNVHSFNSSPLFNNSAKEDFTLQLTSPHINAGNTGANNIGTTKYADATYVTSSGSPYAVANGAIWVNLELAGQDVVISSGFTSGYIISAPRRLPVVNAEVIEEIRYVGLLAYDKSASGGTATNKNVPDANVYTVTDASGGGLPDRLVMEMRWSDSDDTPFVDTDTGVTNPATKYNSADWNNGGYATTGNFLKFPINTQPKVDASGKGNGEPDFDTVFNQPVAAIWIQEKWTLTNAYLN